MLTTNMIRSRSFLLILFALFLFIGIACSAAPEAAPPAEEPSLPEATAPAEPAEEPFAPTFTPLPTPTIGIEIPTSVGVPEEPKPVIPESRLLTFEYPPELRKGDSTRIRLTLEVDDRGNIIPTAEIEGNVVTGEIVEIPNLYDTHLVIAEAQLYLAGMEVQPPGIISENMLPGQSVTFYWIVRPEDAGDYEGMAWLHLRLVPRDGGEETRIPISVQFLEIEVKSLFGFMSGSAARGVGALGSVVGSILGFPFVDDLIKWLLGRIRRN